MDKNIFILNAIIFFYIFQRIGEMAFAKRNEKYLKDNFNAYEINPKESLRMKVFHSLWFITLLIEANYIKEMQSPFPSLIIYLLLGGCMAIRFHSMSVLKHFWSIKVYKMNPHEVIQGGIYKYIRHPNYLIVILELILIPLLFKSYFTLIFFSMLNLFILKHRIQLEESTLMKQSPYLKFFSKTKRLIPYVFMLMIISEIRAAEHNIHANSYDEAKKMDEFVKFESTSTKFGFITTSFDGYAKDIKIKYDLKNDKIINLVVRLPVEGLDTNISSRNEKMLKEILDVKKYQDVVATSIDTIDIKDGEKTVEMIFQIKDKAIKRPVHLKISKNIISGNSDFDIYEAGLPSPDISIAKVRPLFNLSFSIHL